MSESRFRVFGLLLLLGPALAAWSPGFHEAQSMARHNENTLTLARFLEAHPRELAAGARGQNNDQVPTVEDVEDQFRRIVTFTEEHKRPERLVRELGVLAHQVQLLMDPSAIVGATPLRDSFEAYADQQLPKLVLCREPFWAVRAPLNPRPSLLRWAKTKYERHQTLVESFDEKTGKRVGAWDQLSLPFAQLQLAYSNGINGTANLWILLWRAVGDHWDSRSD